MMGRFTTIDAMDRSGNVASRRFAIIALNRFAITALNRHEWISRVVGRAVWVG